jgi:hypothetical protein
MDYIVKGKWDSSSEEEDTPAPAVAAVPKAEAPQVPNPFSAEIECLKFTKSTATTIAPADMPPVVEVKSGDLKVQGPIGDNDGKATKKENPEPSSPSHSPNPNPSKKQKEAHIPLLHGCRSVEEYKRLNFIDQGTYGMVFKARCLMTGEVVALKQVKLGELTSKVGFPITALRETNILLALKHPNIIRVREMVVGSSVDKIFMVMDYCENDLKRCMELAPNGFSLGEVC